MKRMIKIVEELRLIRKALQSIAVDLHKMLKMKELEIMKDGKM